jgi:rhomboid protease GluP
MVESRPICPNCRAFISRADRVCPYCEFELAPKPSESILASRALSDALPRDGKMTFYILGANFFLYLATILFDQQNGANRSVFDPSILSLYLFGAKDAYSIFQGQYWRLITAGFLHASLLHIAFNSWALMQLGQQVDEALGTARYIWVYLFSTMTGFLASSIFMPQAPSVGASAGIFGLLGALIGYATTQGGIMGRYLRNSYLQSALFAVVLTAFFGRTDNWAHFGGLGGGFVATWLIGKLQLDRPSFNRFWNSSAWAAIMLVLLCFVLQLLSAKKMLAS